ncbi:phage/plasmid-like protein TIGR03299 [Aeromonas hydrophila]|nr:phage/plasmid-like protein TIGR03299 [Aeromonas hydrophila]SIR22936.1 phage/plasmid-like protein TIGR03299 [Aeromonas hydrophila]
MSKVLYRSDTQAPLSVVSKRYNVVQPHEVLNFYQDLVQAGRFELETAGVLKGGRMPWALARMGQDMRLNGSDTVKFYLLLATSCDGTLCTTAQFTSLRVVCNNKLQMALNDKADVIKVPHSTKFNPEYVKEVLGLGLANWDLFQRNINEQSHRSVSPAEAILFFSDLINDPTDDDGNIALSRPTKKLQELYQGTGMGSELASAKNTVWGLVNAVTEYIDHYRRARGQDKRLDSAWFGQGAQFKYHALEQALTLLK